MKKRRLDVLVIERGLFATRQTAQTAIMDGAVLVDGEKVTKPGLNIGVDAKIELVPNFIVPKYVSRGGLKLEKGLSAFGIDVSGRECIDVGASTGGFTDCLLKHGAQRVYAIDVGYGQLDWSLRNDARVVVIERMNVRYIDPGLLYSQTDRARATVLVADLSFISLGKVLPACVNLLQLDGAEIVCLVKPQFEVGRESVGKGGVVKSAAAHEQAIKTVACAALENGLRLRGLTYSPVTGPAGNIEYLLYLTNFGDSVDVDCSRIVDAAIQALRKKDKD